MPYWTWGAAGPPSPQPPAGHGKAVPRLYHLTPRSVYLLLWDEDDLDAAVLGPALHGGVVGDGLELAEPGGRQLRGIDRLLLEVARDVDGARGRELPVGRVALDEAAGDRNGVGMSLDADRLVVDRLQDLDDLAEHHQPLGLYLGAPGIEENRVDHVDGQSPLQLGDRHLPLGDLALHLVDELLVRRADLAHLLLARLLSVGELLGETDVLALDGAEPLAQLGDASSELAGASREQTLELGAVRSQLLVALASIGELGLETRVVDFERVRRVHRLHVLALRHATAEDERDDGEHGQGHAGLLHQVPPRRRDWRRASTPIMARPPPAERTLSRRDVSGEREPVQEPTMTGVVVDGVVLRAAVVPEGDRARAPPKPAGELRSRLVAEEIVEQWRAFLLGHAVEAHGVGDVHVERPPARLRMAADDGMRGHVVLLPLAGAVLHAVLAGAAGIRLGRAIDGQQPFEHRLQTVGQRLVRQVHVGEERVAAIRRDLAGDQHARHRWHVEVGGIGVPHAAEVHALVLELQHGNDLRILRQSLHEGILDRLTEAAPEGEELRRREILIPEEDHQMIEPGAPHGENRLV